MYIRPKNVGKVGKNLQNFIFKNSSVCIIHVNVGVEIYCNNCSPDLTKSCLKTKFPSSPENLGLAINVFDDDHRQRTTRSHCDISST